MDLDHVVIRDFIYEATGSEVAFSDLVAYEGILQKHILLGSESLKHQYEGVIERV